jgi:hypothetical protein
LTRSLKTTSPGIEEASRLLGLRAERISYRLGNAAVDIARSFDAFAAEPDGGLVVAQFGPNAATITALAMQHRYRLSVGIGPSKTA